MLISGELFDANGTFTLGSGTVDVVEHVETLGENTRLCGLEGTLAKWMSLLYIPAPCDAAFRFEAPELSALFRVLDKPGAVHIKSQGAYELRIALAAKPETWRDRPPLL